MIFSRRAPRDPVADQLRSLAKQGAGMAKVAHIFAFVLIVLFSAGSLVALAGDALASVLSGWHSGRVDIPSAISVGVSTLLVPCMDVAMLYAASMLRLLATRRAARRDMTVHLIVLAGVALVEAATYAYMAGVYEHPANAAAWSLVAGRALAAPLVGVYLSMARALPVTPRDILYQGELAAGAGVLRDVALAANDQGATLAAKMALYGAAAEMRPTDRERLDAMITAVRTRGTETPADPMDAYPRPLQPGFPLPAPVTPPGGWHPTNGGTPFAALPPGFPGLDDDTTPPGQFARGWESVAETASGSVATAFAPLPDEDARKEARIEGLYASARVWLDRSPLMSKTELRERLGCRQEIASGLYDRWYIFAGGRGKHAAAKADAAEGAQVAQ